MALTEEGSSEGDFVVVVGGFDFAVLGVLDFVDDLRLPPKMFHHERTEIRGNPITHYLTTYGCPVIKIHVPSQHIHTVYEAINAFDMAKSNSQTINYLYPTTNTSPLTTHHTLIVCEAVRCVCPCDDDMDAKEDDCNSDFSMPDQFSRKQIRNATIVVLRRQKPSANALDGLYLPCVDRMLEACWVEGCAESLPRRTCVRQKSCLGFPFTQDGVGFYHT